MCDLAKATGLSRVFDKHGSRTGRCDTCASEAGSIIREAYPDYQVDIIFLQNEEAPSGGRGAVMNVRDKDNQLFPIAQDPVRKQPFHEAIRIQLGDETYVIDALVYERQGLHPMKIHDYFDLWEYPDGIEITDIRAAR